MPYSAGTVFLQVVTSYEGVQDANRKMAQSLGRALEESIDEGVTKGATRAAKGAAKIFGEELGKGTEEAGEESAKKYAGAFRTRLQKTIAQMNRELEPIELRTASSKTLDDIAKVKASLADLDKVKIEPGMDTRGLEKQVAEATKLIDQMAKNAEIDVKYDFRAARAGWDAFQKDLDKFKQPVVAPTVDLTVADRQLGAFEKSLKDRLKKASAGLGDGVTLELQKLKSRLDNLHLQEIGIDISADQAQREIKQIERDLAHLAATTTDIQVHADVTAALAGIESVERRRERLDGQKATVKVNVDGAGPAERKLGLLNRMLDHLKLNGRDTANSFRFFNFAALAVSLTGAALVPILGAVAGGLIAASVAALGLAAALGILLLGFVGIGDAVGALGDVQQNAAKDAQAAARKMRNAAEQIEDAERSLLRARQDAAQRAIDAERSVVDAKQQAARSIENALEQQENAERRLTRANQDAADAQKDLTQARKDAQKELDDIAAKQRRNALDERQGVLDLFTATVEDQAARQDPGATNFEKEQAAINLENAKLRLEDIRKEEKDLADQRKKGVNDNERVKNAQDAVTSAIEAQQEATRALAEANEDLVEARLDGARRVADAVEAQRRAEQDSAEAVSDAQRNLIRAQLDYQDALVETQEIGSASMQKLNEAMGKLSPAGQAFALFLHGLRDEFRALQHAVQEGFLPGLQRAMQRLINEYGDDFIQFAGRMARVLGDLAEEAARVFTNPAWRRFFAMVGDLAPKVTDDFGKAFLNWLTVFANLAVAVAPFALLLSEAMLKLSETVLKWSEGKDAQQLIESFFAYVLQVAPDVKEFFKALALALLAVVQALAMFGDDVLRVLTAILNWIAGLDPQTIAMIAAGLLLMVGAFQALSGFVALFTIVFSPLGGIVLVVLAVAGALAYLYMTSDDFRKLVEYIMPIISDAVALAFSIWRWHMEETFKALNNVITALNWLWKEVLEPFVAWADIELNALWAETINPIFTGTGDLFYEMARDIKWAWDNILAPVLSAIGSIIFQLWSLTVKPVLDFIWKRFSDVFAGIKWAWENVLAPVFRAIADKLGVDENGAEKGGGLVGAFRAAVGLIKSIWDGLKEIAKAPVEFLVNTIMNNGIIDGFNALANHLPGLKKVERIPWPPPGFASGGIPDSTYGTRFGYMPGRDNQLIAVGGGEAILRPEASRVLGAGWVNAINKRAKLQGTQGVSNFLGGFANGGIADGIGTGAWERTTWRGHKFNRRTVQMLQAAEKLAGQVIRITQGSYSTSVAASGSTHAGGGAFDAGWPGMGLGQFLVAALRMVGFAAWHRDPSQGPWNHHIHGIAAGDPTASASAKRQVADYYNGGNGLGGSDDGPNVKKDPSLLEQLKGGITGVVGWVADAISNPVDWLRGKITGKLEKLTGDWGDNTLTKTLKAIPEAIITGMGQLISGGLFSGGETTADPAGVKGMVQQMAASMFGWVGSQWSAIDRIVHKESSWRPDADNPDSTAFGLFQLLKGTAAAYGGQSTDPRKQAQQGLQYIKDRYGSPTEALAFHEAHGWYSDGGTVPDNGTMMYDNGGYLPPGVTRVVNLTGRPEPVFTEDQFDKLGTGAAGSGLHYEPHFHDSDLTAGDVADDLVFTWRRLDDGVLK